MTALACRDRRRLLNPRYLPGAKIATDADQHYRHLAVGQVQVGHAIHVLAVLDRLQADDLHRGKQRRIGQLLCHLVRIPCRSAGPIGSR